VLNLFFVAAWAFLGLGSLLKALNRLGPSLPDRVRRLWIALVAAALPCIVVSFAPVARSYAAGPWGEAIWLAGSAAVVLGALAEAAIEARSRW
jgi:hypothetical protein